MTKTPIQYFRDGYNAAERGEPEGACPLLWDAWPRQAWLEGFGFYGRMVAKVLDPSAEAELKRVYKSPFEQGEVAFLRGRPPEACPYGPDSLDYASWQLGYTTRRTASLAAPIERLAWWRKLVEWWKGTGHVG